jgi:hypothetical protein
LPRSFELIYDVKNKLNLYEAFFNKNHLNLNLLLYKPEVENAFIRLAPSQNFFNSNVVDNDKRYQFDCKNNKRLQAILSRRTKIGLLEAMRLNVIDLKTFSYHLINNNLESLNVDSHQMKLRLDEATRKYKLVDAHLYNLLTTEILLLNTNEKKTIRDCINDSSLHLDNLSFKIDDNEMYAPLESRQVCGNILTPEIVNKMKSLAARITIKSYIISMNNLNIKNDKIEAQSMRNLNLNDNKAPIHQIIISSSSASSSPSSLSNHSNLDNQKKTKIPSPSSSPTSSSSSTSSKNTDNIETYFFGDETDKSLLPINKKTPTPSTSDSSLSTASNLVKETKSFILDYAIDPNDPQKKRHLCINEAKRRGIINIEKGLYIIDKTNSLLIDEAINMGLIGARTTVCEKKYSILEGKDQNDNKLVSQRINTSRLTIQCVLDVKTGQNLKVSEAIKRGIISQDNMMYYNTLTNKSMTFEDAFHQGLIKGSDCNEKTSDHHKSEYPFTDSGLLNYTAHQQSVIYDNSGLKTVINVNNNQQKTSKINDILKLNSKSNVIHRYEKVINDDDENEVKNHQKKSLFEVNLPLERHSTPKTTNNQKTKEKLVIIDNDSSLEQFNIDGQCHIQHKSPCHIKDENHFLLNNNNKTVIKVDDKKEQNGSLKINIDPTNVDKSENNFITQIIVGKDDDKVEVEDKFNFKPQNTSSSVIVNEDASSEFSVTSNSSIHSDEVHVILCVSLINCQSTIYFSIFFSRKKFFFFSNEIFEVIVLLIIEKNEKN